MGVRNTYAHVTRTRNTYTRDTEPRRLGRTRDRGGKVDPLFQYRLLLKCVLDKAKDVNETLPVLLPLLLPTPHLPFGSKPRPCLPN